MIMRTHIHSRAVGALQHEARIISLQECCAVIGDTSVSYIPIHIYKIL